MEDGRLKKADKDYTATLDEQLPIIESTAQTNLQSALDRLGVLEKQTRQASDTASTTRILTAVVRLCYEAGDWKQLQEQLLLFSKKHGQIKQSMTTMVQKAMELIPRAPDRDARVQLIECLRNITEAKIYVEVERERLTRMLSELREAEGDTRAAADILCAEQIETYGSVEPREKTEFILDQVRLFLLQGDYYMAGVYGKKISTKYFDDVAVQDLKLKYYEQQIRLGLYEDRYLDVCKYYRAVADTPSVRDDKDKYAEVLANAVCFVILAKHGNEQSDLMHRLAQDSAIESLPSLYQEMLKSFTVNELMRWPRIAEMYGPQFRQIDVFRSGGAKGEQRWNDLRSRVIEHNVRVIAMYYERIECDRLNQLLDLDDSETERFLSDLVTSGTVYARIDRPARLISFAATKSANDVLNEWGSNISSLLAKIESTRQLILKEGMVHSIASQP